MSNGQNLFKISSYYRSENWQELWTVLHLVNIRAAYSEFNDAVVLSTHAKTIITENPKTTEAEQLSLYALNAGDIEMQHDAYHLPNLSTVMTAKEIVERVNISCADTEFTAVFHGIITTFDLDGSIKFFTRKW